MGVFRRNEPQSATTRSTLPAVISNATAAEAVSYSAPRGLIAAAAQVRINDKGEAEQFRQRRNAMSSAWQAEAWEYYDAIGEIKYAFNLIASVVSRIRLYAAVVENPAETPVSARNSSKIDPRLAMAAERALARLSSAYGGQPGMLRDAALNLCVSGECYLVQLPAKPGSGVPESWDIRSIDEVTIDNRGKYILVPRREMIGNDAVRRGAVPLGNNAFVGRIWRAHPRFTDEADSSLRGLLDLCAELLLLNRTFRATARSRLNAGALYLPDGLSVAAGPDPNYPTNDSEYDLDSGFTPEEAQDEFEDQLIDAMTTPIRDEDSASAVVPLIIRGPAELGDKIKQFKFERSFDPALAQRADRVLERIMQGLDVPKDVVTGLANVKYSNALQIDESLYKAHIEPLMLLIADALTVVYFRPYLLANGFSEADVDRLCIWYDPSQVATRNDRAADADSGFDRMAISFDTWRRAHGFSETDAPTAKEIALRMLMEKGVITPELTEGMLGAVAPEVIEAIRQASQSSSIAPLPPEVQQILGTPGPEESTPQPDMQQMLQGVQPRETPEEEQEQPQEGAQ